MRPVPLLRKGQMRKHRGNQPKLYQAVLEQFVNQQTFAKIEKGTRNEVSPVVVKTTNCRIRGCEGLKSELSALLNLTLIFLAG